MGTNKKQCEFNNWSKYVLFCLVKPGSLESAKAVAEISACSKLINWFSERRLRNDAGNYGKYSEKKKRNEISSCFNETIVPVNKHTDY